MEQARGDMGKGPGADRDFDVGVGRHSGRPSRWWLRAWLWWRGAWLEFLHLVIPEECVACGAEDAALCPACARTLRRQCRAPFRAEQSADALVGTDGRVFVPVIAAGVYRDTLSAAILAFKNHGRTELGPALGRCLAGALAAVAALLPATDVPALPPGTGGPALLPGTRGTVLLPDANGTGVLFVPVPSTGSGWRRRGFDPVAALLRQIVREGRLPPGAAVVPALAHRPSPPWHRRNQKGLGRAARRSNVRNSMRVVRRSWPRASSVTDVRGRCVVVVDDVLTTGATVQEAVRALRKAGARVHGAVVLAAARSPEGEAGPGRTEDSQEIVGCKR